MLSTIKGTYDKGRIVLEEYPETTHPVEVLVTFTREINLVPKSKGKRQFGFGKGTLLFVAPDFNEPLDDLKDYM